MSFKLLFAAMFNRDGVTETVAVGVLVDEPNVRHIYRGTGMQSLARASRAVAMIDGDLTAKDHDSQPLGARVVLDQGGRRQEVFVFTPHGGAELENSDVQVRRLDPKMFDVRHDNESDTLTLSFKLEYMPRRA
jgi:hypothetical protein